MIQPSLTILCGDALEQLKMLPDASVQCCVTSPPYYGLRSYMKDQVAEIGKEQTPEAYISNLVSVFAEVKRVLREDGVLWLNLGDSYGGSSGVHAGGSEKARSNTKAVNATNPAKGGRSKNLLMIPARVALALQADGWYLRQSCPWIKRNAMPESTTDRPTTVIEYMFMLTKSSRYYYDSDAVKVAASNAVKVVQLGSKSFSKGQATGAGIEPSGNGKSDTYTVPARRARRASDWFMESWQGMMTDESGGPLAFVVNTRPYRGAHFATFPTDLIRPCIASSTSAQGCCAACGAPHRRITKSTKSTKSDRTEEYASASGHGSCPQLFTRQTPIVTTLGWEAGCDCAERPLVPCTVLDPFGGSGTTGKVAIESGCSTILIELNPDYIPLIRQRCEVAEAPTREIQSTLSLPTPLST